MDLKDLPVLPDAVLVRVHLEGPEGVVATLSLAEAKAAFDLAGDEAEKFWDNFFSPMITSGWHPQGRLPISDVVINLQSDQYYSVDQISQEIGRLGMVPTGVISVLR